MSVLTSADAKADVTVCIANWNGARWLGDCLRSLRAAGVPSTQVIVVDNASDDDSVAMLRDGFPEAELIVNQENAGYARANNQAILRGRGRYFFILNNDTALAEGALPALVRFMDDHPGAGMAGGRLMDPNGSTQFSYYPVALPSLASLAADLFWLNRLPFRNRIGRGKLARRWNPTEPYKMEQIPGACMLARREALEKVGLFDEGYRFWYEDVDLCARFLRAGWEIWYVPDARIFHQGGASTRLLHVSTRSLMRFRGLVRYAERYFCRRDLVFLKIVVALVLVVRLPMALAVSVWPNAKVRRVWKGMWKAYWHLLNEILEDGDRR